MDGQAFQPLLIVAAATLVSLALVQAVASLFSWVRLARGRRRALKLDLERLEQQVGAARQRRVGAAPDQDAWNGWRKFVVQRVADEAEQVRSFYLKPHDGKPLPAFLPGQYLTFRISVPGNARPVVRCYSLSAAARPDAYRVTIKRVPAPPGAPDTPPGLISNFFHDHVHDGQILDVKAPGGRFNLDPFGDDPVVLLAGGVGITPLLCMVDALGERGTPRETWLFYGVRNGQDHAMKEQLDRFTQAHPWLRLHVCYSDPRPADVAGSDYRHAGRITPELLRQVLPSNNYDFYLCGPPPMMDSLTAALRQWGIPDDRVHFELFGPASVKSVARPEVQPTREAVPVEVLFERSGKACAWTIESGSLLDLAEAHGVAIDAGCRAGNCGTCVTAVKEGAWSYATRPGFAVETGSCLACVAVPSGGRLVLDA